MAFCSNCGQQVNDEMKFCSACGTSMQITAAEPSQQPAAQQPAAPAETTADSFGNKLGNLNDTADTTGQYGQTDIEQNKVMAILSYFGILVLVPILAAKDSPFARFHANQGLVLCIAMLGWVIADAILTAILRAVLWSGLGLWSFYSLCSMLLNLVYIVFTVLAVIGILNAVNGKAKELPIIGKYRILK